MDNVWHYLGLYVGLEFLGVCTGYPVPPSEGYDHLAGGWETTTSLLLSTAFLVSAVLLVVGCLCCRQTKGFQEFTDTTSVQGYVNDASTTEFTIFPPLPPLSAQTAVNQAVRFEPLPDIRPLATRHAKKPAAFNNVVSHGLNAHDWFGDGSVNFPRHQLQYVRELGRGWFGRAVEGSAQLEGNASTACVVKILHEDATVTDQMYFLHEVRPYRDLDHPNVLKMLGRCLEADPFLVLLEACPSGDLKSFLCQNIATAGALSEQGVTLNMACNIAAGLQHMLDNGYVHTDLAARNCLVTPTLGVKIGDYGHSIDAFKEDYYIAGEVALPVRWCAPETLYCTDTTIETKEVTPAANVWSYGVVLWEIGEFGKLPYGELTDDEVVVQVLGENMRRLPKPSLSSPHSNSLYLLMQQCWGPATSRPALPQVVSMLAHLQRHPASDGTLRTTEDFEQRWETFKPNTIVVTDNHMTVQSAIESDRVVIPPTSPQPSTASSCDLFKDNKVKSDSLQNLRGSLDDLSNQWDKASRKHSEGSIPASLGPDFDSWLKGGGGGETDDEDARFVQKISEAIQDLDDALALELTSSESESSKQNTPVRQNTVLDFRLGRQDKEKDSGSSDDTEEEMWRGRIERGEFSAKVKAKSKSVADLMVLTHIEPSDNSDSEPPSLTWSFERRTSNNNSFSRPRKTSLVLFGSESDIHNSILGEDFLESLHKIQVARRDSNRNNSFVDHEQATNYFEADGQLARLDTNRNVDVFRRQQPVETSRDEPRRDSHENVTVLEPKQPTNQNKAESFLAIDASEKKPQVDREIHDGCIISADGDISEAVNSADVIEDSESQVAKTSVNIDVWTSESALTRLTDSSYSPTEEVNGEQRRSDQGKENQDLGNIQSTGKLVSEVIIEDSRVKLNEARQKEAINTSIVSRLPTEIIVGDKMPLTVKNLSSEQVIIEPSDRESESLDEKKESIEMIKVGTTKSHVKVDNSIPEILVSESSPTRVKTPVESPRKPVPLPRRKLYFVSRDSLDESKDVVQSIEGQENFPSLEKKHDVTDGQSSFKSREENLETAPPLDMILDISKPCEGPLDQVSTIEYVQSSKSLEKNVECSSPLEEGESKSLNESRENISCLENVFDSFKPLSSVERISPLVLENVNETQSLSESHESSVDVSFTSSTPYKPHVVARQRRSIIGPTDVITNPSVVAEVSNGKAAIDESKQHSVIPSVNVIEEISLKRDKITETRPAVESRTDVETSTKNSALSDTSVIIGPCEDYTLEYFKGLKTAYHENHDYDVDYSINGWDSFLGASLETHQYDDVNFISTTPDVQLSAPSVDQVLCSDELVKISEQREDLALLKDDLIVKDETRIDQVLDGKNGREDLVLFNNGFKPTLKIVDVRDSITGSQDFEAEEVKEGSKNSVIGHIPDEFPSSKSPCESVDVSGCAIEENISTDCFNIEKSDVIGNTLQLGELKNNTFLTGVSLECEDNQFNKATENLIAELKNIPEVCSKEVVEDIATKDVDDPKPALNESESQFKQGEMDKPIVSGNINQGESSLKKDTDELRESFSKPTEFVVCDLVVKVFDQEEKHLPEALEDLEETLTVTLVGDVTGNDVELPLSLENVDEKLIGESEKAISKHSVELVEKDGLELDTHLLLNNFDQDESLRSKSDEFGSDVTEVFQLKEEVNNSPYLILENVDDTLNSKQNSFLEENHAKSVLPLDELLDGTLELTNKFNGTPVDSLEKLSKHKESTNTTYILPLLEELKNETLDPTEDLSQLKKKLSDLIEDKSQSKNKVDELSQLGELGNKTLELTPTVCVSYIKPVELLHEERKSELSTNKTYLLPELDELTSDTLKSTEDSCDLNNKSHDVVNTLKPEELTNEKNNLRQSDDLKETTLDHNQSLHGLNNIHGNFLENEIKSQQSINEMYMLPEALEKPVTQLDGDLIEPDFTLSGFHINVLASGDDLHDLDEEEEECDEFSLDVKHSTPDDERSSDSGFRDNKGSLSESCEDACDEKYNLEDIEAELEETYNRGGFNHHEENGMVFGEEYNSKCSSNTHNEDRPEDYSVNNSSIIEGTPEEYSTKSSKECVNGMDNFYDTLESDNIGNLKKIEVSGDTFAKTNILDNTIAEEDKTDVKDNVKSDGITSVKQSGWYLHPPTELDAEDDSNAKSSSYVSFSLDEEFVTAIRNELIDKLPLANESADKLLRANYNGDDLLDMDEDDLEERQDMMIHYNVYQAPLSPILEEPESLGMFDWSTEKRSSFEWPAEAINERFEEDIREALEGCSFESSSSSDKDPSNSILLEDLDNLSKVIKVKSTSTDLEDDILVVNTETNEARLLESPKPKPHLAFVTNKPVASLDGADGFCIETFSPGSNSPTTTSSGTSEFLTPSDVSPLHLPSTPAPVQQLTSNNEAAEIMSDLAGMYEQESSYEDCTQSYESSDMSPVDRLDLLTANATKPNDLQLTCLDTDLDRTLKLNDLGQLLRLASLETSIKDKSPVSPEVNLASKDVIRQFVNTNEFNLNSSKLNDEVNDLLSPDSESKYEENINNTELLQEDLSALNEVAASSMLAFSGPRSSALEDITFSGPGMEDAGEMSTSFSGHGDEEDDDDEYAPDWESDSEENSSSSGEFIWQDGETTRPIQQPVLASPARPQAKAYECLANYPMESIAEEDENDDEDDDSSTCSSSSGSGAEFVPSAWNSQATPVRSALRSPEKTTDWKKNVTFKKQKYHCVYEYPRDSSEDTETESASWRPSASYSIPSPASESPAVEYSSYSTNSSPAVNYLSYSTNNSPVVSYANYSTNRTPEVDYASYADWELMDGEEVEADTESESDNIGKSSRPDKFDFYKLGGEDYDFSGGLDDGEFFISSSARPFQTNDAIASQFFPGQSDTSFNDDEIDLTCLEPTSPMSPTGLGELRHTRDRLKLNLLDAPPVKKVRNLSGEATLLDSDTEDSGIESSNGMTAQLTLKTTLDTSTVDQH